MAGQGGRRGWGLREAEHCSARVRGEGGEARAAAEREVEEEPLPTLEGEIARLAARRNQVDRWLESRLGDCAPGEAVRYLTALASVARSLAELLGRREAEGGGDELQRVLAEAARLVRERAGEGDDSPRRREDAKTTRRDG
ncbi:MAG TPA: hypothetical protein PLG21_15105 [Anaerolineae bacterium]|nr:hypothetical protein [Anaerolineae bacterium]